MAQNKFRFWIVLLVFSLAFPARAPSAAAQPMTVWTEPVGSKVQPTTAAGSGSGIQLEGPRDAYLAYQVVVKAGSSGLSGVNLAASRLAGAGGAQIAAANLVFFREDFIDFTGVSVTEHGNLEVPQNSPTNDARLPDPLVPFIDPYSGLPAGAPFSVPANQNQPVWLDVYVPHSTPAGLYSGVITVTAASLPPVNLPISVEVWDIIQPDMQQVTTYFGMHVNDLIDFHSGTAQCSGANCWLDWNARSRLIVKRYEELAHTHRAGTWPNFVPDPGNGCQPPVDWSGFDAAMAPYMNGSYWQDGVPSSWFEAPFSPGVTWGLETCSQAQYTALAQAWAAHLKAKTWFSRAIAYAYDEPDPSILPAIAQHAQWMQAGDPDWKAHILVTTNPEPSNAAILNPAIGIYTVALSAYANWDHYSPPDQVPYGRTEWQELFKQGFRLWFYESNAQGTPYPTFATNTLLGDEPLTMMWGAWYEHASGFLLWDTTAWDLNNPWGPNILFAKTGDGVLIYPGNHAGQRSPAGSPAGVAIDGPIPSYRLKVIRLGLQDWALFKLAESYGLGAVVRADISTVYGQLGGCTWQGCPPMLNGQFFWKADPALIAQARHAVAQAILAAAPSRIYLPKINR